MLILYKQYNVSNKPMLSVLKMLWIRSNVRHRM